MGFVDHSPKELLPSNYQELPLGGDRSSRRRKVFRKITLLLTFVLLLGLVLKDVTFVQEKYAAFSQSLDPKQESWDWPIPHNLRVLDCPEVVPSFAEIGETSVQFELPLSSESLFLISRGSYSSGQVYLAQSDKVSDSIKVEIVVHYKQDDDDRDLVKICQVSWHEGQNGVGIFTPRRIRHRHNVNLHFDVHVTLPLSKESNSPLYIPVFDIDMPVFSQYFGDLSSVFFDLIGMKTVNAAVEAESVVSRYGMFSNINGAIQGYFNASEYLELSTVNGVIDVTVDLNSLDEASTSVLKMDTTNAAIKSVVLLISSNTTGGNFYVSGHTARGPVTIDFPSAPIDSNLTLHAATTVGSVHAGLHETYEGTFELKTVMGQTILDFDKETEEERGRTIKVERITGGRLVGSALRSKDGAKQGHVDLSTVMAKVELAF